MLFNSLLFLLFFLVVTSAYYLLTPKLRWIWLLLVSCYFYMYFKPVYILIILFTIVIDYIAGLLIEKAQGSNKKFFLLASIIANVGVLAVFKYFDFFAGNINFLSHHFNGPQIPLLHILLPIGLSFHTFQAMSYTIEVYRGNQKAEKHFGIYALYVLFYPQMVAGPIERPQHILPQLHRVNQFNTTGFITGIFLIAIGLFKKMVIADRLGMFVDPVFNNPHGHSAFDLLVAVYFFAFQIYCDFSGYSDIAVGAALTLGIELMRNFNMPYLSKNIAEFWQRWHISLSTWFRDYVYIPLGGSRVTFTVTCINILVVFIISGLWHGANWKYLVWGLVHGLLLIGYQLLKKFEIHVKGFSYLQWILTFNLVCLAWIFFRANTVTEGIFILNKIFTLASFHYTAASIMPWNEIFYCIFIILALLGGEWYLQRKAVWSKRGMLLTTAILFIACYFLGIFNEAQFIYFQF
ncbi:D-alanyl-lipoteichoic acid acyltransferase DltB, MBOAT superfamily [Mucilaginibacter lappiensis]|uniref:D-alanyl-lipoteichoic acid acyltransferase DltB (MBOAT superfamily) n=1 Tax=Mucilaginibacter lappiensis TaxID=354630 RepID=A0ABR6PPI8_9SPHI|nr:MBOAT family O-acyltransferase [Mucilaginibacter lappiensis]MBB6110910.1 D-alanyl-lipoteichoic acid acyltransferase DltB (MBOAT superfamily) [Mucilaginibacter lappiensis]SIR60835.1 D-alanyl-lipoteichoic acid acyltransferase DltB, MBOAT superfamily [Mucilaginibacter lappiensis]